MLAREIVKKALSGVGLAEKKFRVHFLRSGGVMRAWRNVHLVGGAQSKLRMVM